MSIWKKEWHIDLPEGGSEIRVGPKHQARLKQWIDAEGDKHEYEGRWGEERRVRLTFTTGDVMEYEWFAGDERMVRFIHAGDRINEKGEVDHHAKSGPYDQYGNGRKKMTVYTSGETSFYTGPVGEERLVMVKMVDPFFLMHYDGPKDQERKIRIEFPDGRVCHRGAILWGVVRCWFLARRVAMYWLKCKEERVCAPGGVGRKRDLEAFEADFRS
jgi:hypothetical protein